MTRQRLTAEERKRGIIEAALPLFAGRGFAETTTRDIAEAAGISEPLLYKHFPSKERLYDEILDSACNCKDPALDKLAELEPSTSTLVHLVYFLMRAMLFQRPGGAVPFEMRFRLMVNSLLEDGAYARMVYQKRFAPFCSRIEACLNAAIARGDAIESPISSASAARFAHHLGAWVALSALPEKPTLDYKASKEELLEQLVWFILRGMGVKDTAIATHFNPKSLALYFS